MVFCNNCGDHFISNCGSGKITLCVPCHNLYSKCLDCNKIFVPKTDKHRRCTECHDKWCYNTYGPKVDKKRSDNAPPLVKCVDCDVPLEINSHSRCKDCYNDMVRNESPLARTTIRTFHDTDIKGQQQWIASFDYARALELEMQFKKSERDRALDLMLDEQYGV